MKAKLLRRFRKRFEVHRYLNHRRVFNKAVITTVRYAVFDHKYRRVETCETSEQVVALCAIKMLGASALVAHEQRRRARKDLLNYYKYLTFRDHMDLKLAHLMKRL